LRELSLADIEDSQVQAGEREAVALIDLLGDADGLVAALDPFEKSA
jgi:hypothetical protein